MEKHREKSLETQHPSAFSLMRPGSGCYPSRLWCLQNICIHIVLELLTAEDER